MKECFCFLFGLILGGGGLYQFYCFLMRKPQYRVEYLRQMHRRCPEEYHLACELDKAELYKLEELKIHGSE